MTEEQEKAEEQQRIWKEREQQRQIFGLKNENLRLEKDIADAEIRMREKLNERIAVILVTLAVVAVLSWVVWAIYSSAVDSREKDQAVKMACITSGGTWIDDTAKPMCISSGRSVQK